jgi:hypothetical protein
MAIHIIGGLIGTVASIGPLFAGFIVANKITNPLWGNIAGLAIILGLWEISYQLGLFAFIGTSEFFDVADFTLR